MLLGHCFPSSLDVKIQIAGTATLNTKLVNSWIIICFCQHCLWQCELIANSRISPSQQGGGLFWLSSQGDSIRPNRTFACTWNWSSIFLWPPWELVWKGGGRDCSQMGPTHVQGGGKGRSEFYSKVSSLAPAIPERRPRDAQKSWHFFTSLITVCLSAARKGVMWWFKMTTTDS